MLIRTEILMKWLAYGLAAALVCLLQGAALQYVRLFGVMPFLYPLLAAVVAMLEGSSGGTVWCLTFGVACDAVLPGPIPCFYTMVFPVVGLCAGGIAVSWLPAGFPCAFIVSALAFFLVDGFHALLLALTGKAAWAAAGMLACREAGASLLFVPLVYLLFRRVHRKVHADAV